MIGRVPIFDISPSVSGGQLPVKAVVGEKIEVSATIFSEGQALIGANVVLVDSLGGETAFTLMHEFWPGSDRWSAVISPSLVGDWQFYIEAWHHPIATWMQTAKIKIPLELDVELVFEEGARFFEELVTSQSGTAKKLIEKLIKKLRDDTTSAQSRLSSAFDPEIEVLVTKAPLRHFVTRSLSTPVQVDRERALIGAWYEFFPRSEGADLKSRNKPKSGTLISSMARLDEVARMGFDVVYLPPIHPIGTSHRKGPNNTLTPGPNDPGVPWAIGNKDGGHDSINPELGTLEDFDKFLAHARELGIEIALDLALQASPNHPWVKQHPEWFSSRVDGSIAYAENPPKKYEDIYPLNFDNDYEGIFATIVQIVRFWMERGVRIFRVDNPHTKPLYFWRDLLVNIRATDPDVIFLAEAFTRPSIMHSLGKIGFHQSYTYFTWRTSKRELEEYGREISHQTANFFRPNFWVNTPDILAHHLQTGAPEVFSLRALLAATMVPSWGMYSGYELFEHEVFAEGGEEYLNSEKYQLKPRDWLNAAKRGHTLAPFITTLNRIRKTHPALQQLRNLHFHDSDSEQVLVYSKAFHDDRILVVANLDPTQLHETWIHLDLGALGLPDGNEIEVEDLLSGLRYTWARDAFVRLDPEERVAHLLKVL